MSVVSIALLFLIASSASVYVGWRLVGSKQDPLGPSKGHKKPERYWREEIQSLRGTMLQLRVDLADLRKSTETREADIQRLRVELDELRRAFELREADVRRALGASGQRLRLVEDRVSIGLASLVEEETLTGVG